LTQVKEKNEDTVSEMHKSNALFNKQIQDIYVQMRKLSSDVFDQIKAIRSTTDINFMIEKERENMRQQHNSMREDFDGRMASV
jgi:hypothetical protein